MDTSFLPSTGGYRSLRVYRLTEIVFDLSVVFIDKYVPAKSRTRDQMEQAARSGKQNIAEGSKASKTSRETEIKLTNVAKASLEELLIDYEDYLRTHRLPIWDKNHPRTLRLRNYLKSPEFMANPMQFVNRIGPEEFCNMCITLIRQATYMLDRLLEAQQKQFLQQGGIREQMTRARLNYRNNKGYHTGQGNYQTNRTNQSNQTNQTGINDQTGQTDQTDQTNRTNQTDQTNLPPDKTD